MDSFQNTKAKFVGFGQRDQDWTILIDGAMYYFRDVCSEQQTSCRRANFKMGSWVEWSQADMIC